MPALSQWRKFNFFEPKALSRTDASLQLHTVCQTTQGARFTAAAGTSGFLALGDNYGTLHTLNRSFECVSVQAHENPILSMFALQQSHTLVTLEGDIEDVEAPGGHNHKYLKAWDFADAQPEDGHAPQLVRSFRVDKLKEGRGQVVCFACTATASMTALGYDDGHVVLILGNILRERNPSKSVVFSQPGDKITSLKFVTIRRGPVNNSQSTVYLYITTESETGVLTIRGRNNVQYETLDMSGAEMQCTTLAEGVFNENDLIVARKEAVFFYNVDGLGPCFAFDGTKRSVAWFRDYLVLATVDGKLSSGSMLGAREGSGRNVLTIYDINRKYVAYQSKFDDIAFIVKEWGFLHIINSSGIMMQLDEQDTQTKLNILFKKSLYPLAIELASSSQNYDTQAVYEVFKQYGDYLYSKGDTEGAMIQYTKTIGVLEPSYVIKKYLDIQALEPLIQYLQVLHDKSAAGPTHTTLLLQCYTRLGKAEQLEGFLTTTKTGGEDEHGAKQTTQTYPSFDVNSAIKALRNSGFLSLALNVARRFHNVDWFITISVYDLKEGSKALEYLQSLPLQIAAYFLRIHGVFLIEQDEEQTVKILIDLCSTWPGPTEISEDLQYAIPFSKRHEAELLIQENGKRAKPEEFFHVFVKHAAQFLTFAETVHAANHRHYAPVVNVLLELYLRPDIAGSKSEKKERQAEALKLLKDEDCAYDPNQALLICGQNDFSEGLIYLLETNHMYSQILDLHIRLRDTEAILRTCTRYGAQDLSLWSKALTHFSTNIEEPADANAIISEMLVTIERQETMTPFQMVKLLIKAPNISITVVRDFLLRWFNDSNGRLASDEETIRELAEKNRDLETQLEDLQTKAKTFHLGKCKACRLPLELPVVHFLCGHSYHDRCLNEDNPVCMQCDEEYQRLLNMSSLSGQPGRSGDDHHEAEQERFLKQIEGARNKFEVVAEEFALGVIDN
eukprot:Clim_evm44s246 gene=Clim_evmTU44s246